MMEMFYLRLYTTKSKRNGKIKVFASCLTPILISLLLVIPVLAGTENGEFCPTCPDWNDLDGWQAKKVAYDQEQQQQIQLQNQATTLKTQNDEPAQAQSVSDPVSSSPSQMRTGRFAEALVSPTNVSPNDVVLDISPNATRYIEGAVNIDYEQFIGEGGQLKPVSEIAGLLGGAGISRNDSLVITGECLPCGGGPSPAIFTYWLLKYLGHDKVRVLDGSIDDWKAAGQNTSNKSVMRPKTTYAPLLKTELLATYDFVVNGGAQIVDARPARDYSISSIPKSVNIPYENVVDKEKIKSEEDLQKVFIGLEKDRPVVVYTNIGVEASLVWFALTLSGYDARLYSLRDWLENQPKFNFELADVNAKPNPVKSSSTTTITASFQEMKAGAASDTSSGEIKLTVKGCTTCGFGGFSLGATGTGNKSEMVQLGSSGKASSSNGIAMQTVDSDLHCIAIISAPDGSEAARTSLLRTSGYKYVGIWKASVAPGVYKVSIVATVSGNTETFPDVLKIEVKA